ncbi:MAG: sensor histidine kinase [Dorea sp.]
MKQKKRVTTKRKIIHVIFMVVVPFFVVLLVFNIYSIHKINDNLRETGEEYVNSFQNGMVTELEMIQSYIEEIISNHSAFRKLMYSNGVTEAHINIQEVAEELRIMQWSQNAGGGYIIYDQNSSMFREVYLYYSDYDFADKEGFRDYMRAGIQEKERDTGWNVQIINGKNYLLRIFGKGNVYIMGIYDLQILMEKQDKGEEVFLFLTDEEGKILVGNENKEEDCLRIEKKAENLPVIIFYDMPNSGTRAMFYRYPLTMAVLTLCTVIVFIIGFGKLEEQYLRPFQNLIETMKKITDGNEDAKMQDDSDIIEFHELAAMFDSMLEEIKAQKLESYENRIEVQNTRIQYYQAQIKPHFLQNCLSSMYALAECGKYGELQNMILAFSQYLQSVMQNNSTVCTLEEELHNVENYILLQKLILSRTIICNIEIEEELERKGIPPLSILTFVENSIKYRSSGEQELKIQIKVADWNNEGERYLEVTVLDNGDGFSEEWLEKLNSTEEVEEEGHIGIQNVKKRFKLKYGEKASFLFFNMAGSGAAIQFFFPVLESCEYKMMRRETWKDESVDC